MKFSFTESNFGKVHPNTAQFIVSGKHGHTLNLQLSSIGGGRI
ncbi:MAG: hypothetical protein RBT69_05505 [Spirochaetia bacterium]|jgi:L-serine deaminase|nr:hypothetical protein [Spirochaetia bacterium]